MVTDDLLDLGTDQLVSIAFDKSWQFVRTDPELAHVDMSALRARLSTHLETLARNGERDVWHLANGAIRELRREHAPLTHRPAA